MKIKFAFFVFLALLLSGNGMGTEYAAELQGYSAINKTLRDRLFDEEVPNPFSFSSQIFYFLESNSSIVHCQFIILRKIKRKQSCSL